MGRTRRKRMKKVLRDFETCDHTEEIVSLNSWLSKCGLSRNKKLVLALFEDTGRGVLTKRQINPGEELLNMPLNITINITTLLMDKSFNSLFFENKLDCFTKYKQAVSFQSLLAFFLVYHRVQETSSQWYLYLKSLPEKYLVPYFLPKDIQCFLDAKILTVISKQCQTINSSFTIFKEILQNYTNHNVILNNLKENYSLSLYEWAYFTVNTRCVFMDLTKVVDMRNKQNCILNMLNDNTNIALCPYLDMINHSPKAKNETKLILCGTFKNVSKENICVELLSDIRFSIYTNNCFEPYTQVYICYGDSYNFKLLTEYGFILPNNDLDYIPFDFETVEMYLKLKQVKLSQLQTTFINSHGLSRHLYIDSKGLSFNFYALLMVVKFYYKQHSDVNKLIYSAMDGIPQSSNFNEFITPLVQEKILSVKRIIDELEKCGKTCIIVKNYVEFMCHLVDILEKFIKS